MNAFRPSVRRLSLASALVLALSGAALAQKVRVDGDLTDIAAVAPATLADPAGDVSPIAASGFDFTRVYAHYYPKRDTLYVGLDLADTVGRVGVPGDADGDGDPSRNTSGRAAADEFGVGYHEFYRVEIDSDLDGSFTGPLDLWIEYRGNDLAMKRGDGTALPPGMRGRIALGTRGAPIDPNIPNQDRNCDDVEISVFGFANLDPAPRSFAVRVRAGSSVDSLPDDSTDDSLPFSFGEPLVLRTAFVDGGHGSSGDCVIAFPGDVLTVEATVTNAAAGTLRPTWAMFHLPTGIEYVGGSASGAEEGRIISAADGTGIRFVRLGGGGRLETGESVTFRFQVRAVSFPVCHLTIRGYAEGVLASDGVTCEFSCLETLCILE